MSHKSTYEKVVNVVNVRGCERKSSLSRNENYG